MSSSICPVPRLSKSITVAKHDKARTVVSRSTTTTTCSVTAAGSASLDSDEYEDDEEDSEFDEEEEEIDGEFRDEIEEVASGAEGGVEEEVRGVVDRSRLPNLTVKEKKELASYAHSLGKKLKMQLVGKSGVTASVAASFVETLEANELLKIKIHATCPDEVPDVVKQLEDYTGSVVVSQIGRTVIMYRPSISKMKAEQKKRQERRVYVRKSIEFKPSFPKKGGTSRPREETPRPNERGRRGSSRVKTADSY